MGGTHTVSCATLELLRSVRQHKQKRPKVGTLKAEYVAANFPRFRPVGPTLRSTDTSSHLPASCCNSFLHGAPDAVMQILMETLSNGSMFRRPCVQHNFV